MLLSSTNHLVLSRSCNFFFFYPFSRSVVFSFEFSHLIKFLFNYFSFQSECCPKLFFLVPLAEWSVLNFVHLRRVISSSFATSQGSMVSLICQRSNLFYLFLFRVFLRCHPRSRDEILLQWWSVVTPQDRRFRRLPYFRDHRGFLLCLLFYFLHCIMSSCHHVINLCIKTQLNKLHGSPIHLNRGNSHGVFSL